MVFSFAEIKFFWVRNFLARKLLSPRAVALRSPSKNYFYSASETKQKNTARMLRGTTVPGHRKIISKEFSAFLQCSFA
jgi:hypothetical protein